jgi:hypothetical protein
MSFYQVLVAVEPEAGKLRCIATDLSEPQLLARFVKPYRNGTDLICGNEIVLITALRKIHIVRTAREDQQERNDLNAKSLKEIEAINREPGGVVFLSLGRGYDPDDILEVGTDVTAEFISGPPGGAHNQSRISRLLSNPWVQGIGISLIAAAIGWWLGWS